MPELAGSNVVLIGSGISVNALILSFGAGLLVGILYRVPALILLNAATLAAIAIFAVALGWSFGYMRKRFPNTLLPKLI
jgi:xanthosine utilization system XapX-like protein